MPELDDAIAAAAEARAAAEQAATEATAAAERVQRLRRAQAEAARRRDPRPSVAEATASKAEQELAAAEEAAVEARRRSAARREAHVAAEAAVGLLADPRLSVGRLADDLPILLMPLRIETRFTDDELLVRVYPDDWAVDTFEERLSDLEVKNARRYWAGEWRAGGDVDLRKAAWRGLVASHGSGRAAWIVRHYEPTNPGDAPTRAGAGDVILVVVVDDPLSAAERTAGATYWEAVWRAADDADAVAAAEAALEGALGAARAAAVRAQPPFNRKERPVAAATRADAVVEVAYLDLPDAGALDTKPTSWTQPPRARVLPDRFVLLGWVGDDLVLDEVGGPVPPTLVVGPDPSAGPDEALRVVDGKLVVPEDLAWMVDFDRAVADGMGFRVPLQERTRGGFTRLFAIGLRVAADPQASQAELEALVRRHASSRSGFALVPQGSPTNNTESAAAGLDRVDDADASWERVFGSAAGLEDRPEWERKQDGQWLAEALGIDPAVLAEVAGATGTDQLEARAVNAALWPATWGYFLDTMLHPLLEDGDVEQVRRFFLRYVSGRGLVPSIRIGRQPYGILPTTAFSRLRFEEEVGHEVVARLRARLSFLGRLHALLNAIAEAWEPLAAAVPAVGSAGDPHQALLDIVGHHPVSVEFHQRYAESIEDLFNRLNFWGFGEEFVRLLEGLAHAQQGREVLRSLGWEGDDPDILDKVFLGSQHPLLGPLVDDRPVSETEPVRGYTDDGRNYLAWLVDAAGTSLETLRQQPGFSGERPPTALLYLLARHALLLSWWDAGLRFTVEAGVLTGAALQEAKRERTFVHVTPDADPGESRWHVLYTPEAAVTGDQAMLLADFIPTALDQGPARRLHEVADALARLQNVPTARLERALVEHLDCCSYRLDAWRLGLVHHRLLAMRLGAGEGAGDGEGARRGIHLGAYGWLEDVRPRRTQPERVELRGEQAKTFGEVLLRDRANGGFVHAPSLNHATTAAVLRSGYLANATRAAPGTMAVNLSSERVRMALAVLEGIRNGRPLAALLGYRFERGLHDRHSLAEVDKFIHPLRKAFPSDGGVRHVVDGRELVAHVQRPGNRSYPFGRTDLPPATPAEAAAIDAEVDRLLDVHDAVADLALAEGVHQAVLGNYDRVASTLDAYSKIGFPPEPAVVETPRSGIALTHRVGIHLRAGLSHTTSPVAGVAMTPRAMAEPAVNEFLAELLLLPGNVGVRVQWQEAGDAAPNERVVTQEQLGLQPADLLHLVHLDDRAALGELDERILRFVETAEGLRPDTAVAIRHTERLADAARRTFFELAPLLRHARSVVQRSRPLRPSDVVLANEASDELDARMSASEARPAAVLASLQALRLVITTLEGDLAALPADPAAGLDGFVDRAVAALDAAGRHNIGGAGWGEVTERRRAVYVGVLAAVAEVVARWEGKLAEADRQLAIDTALPAAATEPERVEVLMAAERAVRAALTDPRPASADAYRTTVEGHRASFALRLGQLRAVGGASVAALVASARATLPLVDFDAVGLDLGPTEERIEELYRYLLSRVASVGREIDRRVAAAQQHLADHAATASPARQVELVVAATRALLGEATVVVPEFRLGAAHGDEWEAALAWSRTGGLTAHLAPSRPFPVEDWAVGVARVREKVRAWEQLGLLGGAVGRLAPDLVPAQLPHASEPWLALELPAGHAIAGDRLLYTAHYPMAFDKDAAQCGLLLDEWTEVVPGTAETTGLAFHFDRPDSEPPQAMLLVTPPVRRGAWEWDDLVASLHETLALARLRAVEPAAVDGTGYATFLPATVTAATLSGVSIALNFALNNGVLDFLGEDR